MAMAILRVPYTDALPLPRIIPSSARCTSGAIAALVRFLAPKATANHGGKTLLLTGAGISVASGLADYRGKHGTYTLNKAYQPIYYNEFCENHEARKRYWARSFLGWAALDRARPNRGHAACGALGRLGVVGRVITQNVDSLHPHAHPDVPTTELHGYLRSLVCLTCRAEYPRRAFQSHLARLNPAWSALLDSIRASAALDTEDPAERRAKGLATHPDGDVDVPDAPYTTFRYPACPVCVQKRGHGARIDQDGAWDPTSRAGVLKPAVIMFGESIPAATKREAERAVDGAGRILVVGSSLATYSAWRLVKRAQERGMPIGILNLGGARGDEGFFGHVGDEGIEGETAVRVSDSAEVVLPEVVSILEGMREGK